MAPVKATHWSKFALRNSNMASRVCKEPKPDKPASNPQPVSTILFKTLFTRRAVSNKSDVNGQWTCVSTTKLPHSSSNSGPTARPRMFTSMPKLTNSAERPRAISSTKIAYCTTAANVPVNVTWLRRETCRRADVSSGLRRRSSMQQPSNAAWNVGWLGSTNVPTTLVSSLCGMQSSMSCQASNFSGRALARAICEKLCTFL
mmetsp:Transcript_35168/g.88627  ORF Transcript_35168/g.88627 Transcript_35168/m.88627 type:complete len:202 (-) Transcript_35168:573-1178(-)